MTRPDFTSTTDERGIATITWDVPGRAMNVLSAAGLEALESAFDTALADPQIRGVVITSGKEDFAGGMDLTLLSALQQTGGSPAEAIFATVMRVHALLRRIERGDPARNLPAKPVAAALPGTALGLGLELPLACHRTFLADRPEARIGLPEIRLGLFPGAGGTTRLLRRLGLMAAAPYLLEGRTVSPSAAARAGLVEQVVAPDHLLQAARDWVAEAAPEDLRKPWDSPGWKMPGGAPYSRDGFPVFAGAPAMVTGRTRGLYPAAEALLRTAYEGAQVPFDTALRIEARQFTSVLLDPVSAAMIRTLFIDKRALDKSAEASPPARIAVIGAGMMGSGIARAAAAAGIETLLTDSEAGLAEKAMTRIGEALRSNKRTAAASENICDRITPGGPESSLAGRDLIIEAVFEDPDVKAGVLSRAEASLPPGAVLATNTSSLPVTGLAQSLKRPDSFLGLHFFSPVDKMPLVEIIRGPETGDAAIGLARAFVRSLGKTPIILKDAPFFFANRCIIPYLDEGIRMLIEGVPPAMVEHAALALGMPLGPLQLTDEVSLSLGLAIAAQAPDAARGEKREVTELLQRLVDLGRSGRKAGAGFYDYGPRGERLSLWAGLGGLSHDPEAPLPPLQHLSDRLMLIQVLEAVRALEAEVLQAPRDGDVAAILGWGFAPWSGGPFTWIDTTGPAMVCDLADRLAAAHGSRFTPPESLRRHAREGSSFRPPLFRDRNDSRNG